MKKISVNKNCNGCGLCIVNSPYLRESLDGNAEPVPGKAILEQDLSAVMKVISECPEKALEIINTGITEKSGQAGLNEIIVELKKKCKNFSIKKVENSDVRFNADDYSIHVPYSRKEYRYDYTSESSARSAAKEEFNRLCYSSSAYRPILKKVFVEYKVKVLKPYYTCTDTDDNVYYQYNQQVRKLLADVYMEISGICKENNKIPESWKDFSVYLSERDSLLYCVRNFDERSTESGIITDLKNRGKYTDLSWYMERIDFDYTENYLGDGLFGRSRYKKMWCFSGMNEEVREFIEDLKGSIDSMSSDIEDAAVRDVNIALTAFEEKVKKTLETKITELEQYIDTMTINF